MQRSIIAPAERVTNLRWAMAAIAAFGAFTTSLYGTMFVPGVSAGIDRMIFVVALGLAALPAGVLIDRFGVRPCGTIASLLWAAFSALGIAREPTLMPFASAGLGVAAAALYPLAIKSTSAWFPRFERGGATSLVVGASALALTVAWWGFGTFTIGALLGVVAAAMWALAYRDPVDGQRGVTYAERTFIVDGGSQTVLVPAASTLGAIVRSPSVWLLAVAFGAFAFAFASTPLAVWSASSRYTLGFVVALAAGFGTDAFGTRRTTFTRVRIATLAVGAVCACAALGAGEPGSVVTTIATFLVPAGCAAALPIAWAAPGFLAAPGTVGTMSAVVLLAGTIGAATAQAFGPDVIAAAIAAIIAATMYIVGLGRIERATTLV